MKNVKDSTPIVKFEDPYLERQESPKLAEESKIEWTDKSFTSGKSVRRKIRLLVKKPQVEEPSIIGSSY